ncbi:NFU1 iron-sulfur cluster scaffold homolog, mitochondrial-like [Ciona intestinalis]
MFYNCSISTMFCTPFSRQSTSGVSVSTIHRGNQYKYTISQAPTPNQTKCNYEQLAGNTYNIYKEEPTLRNVLSRNIMVARPGLVVVKNAPSLNIHSVEVESGRSMIFYPGCPVLHNLNEQKIKYHSRHPCYHSPLVRQIMKIDGIESVTLFTKHIHIQKNTNTLSPQWSSIKPIIVATLINFFASQLPTTTHHQSKRLHYHKESGECVAYGKLDDVEYVIDDLINSRIRPTVQDEGGDVIYKDFNCGNGTVYVLLLGSCLYTPKATNAITSATLLLLQYHVPCVTSVVQMSSKGPTL